VRRKAHIAVRRHEKWQPDAAEQGVHDNRQRMSLSLSAAQVILLCGHNRNYTHNYNIDQNDGIRGMFGLP